MYICTKELVLEEKSNNSGHALLCFFIAAIII
jgi:hypothetical protein